MDTPSNHCRKVPEPVDRGAGEVQAPVVPIAPVLAPLFMPTATVVPAINCSGATTVRKLIEHAEIQVNEAPSASDRQVVLRRDGSLGPGELGPLECEAGPSGAVAITVSSSLTGVDAARQALAVLAYALFDAEARAAVRGQPWTRFSVNHH